MGFEDNFQDDNLNLLIQNLFGEPPYIDSLKTNDDSNLVSNKGDASPSTCDPVNTQKLKNSYDSTVNFISSFQTNGSIKCPHCRHSTPHKQDMIDHINSKHIRYPAFECEICHEKYFSKRKMKEHKKRKHELSSGSSSLQKKKMTNTTSQGSLKRPLREIESQNVNYLPKQETFPPQDSLTTQDTIQNVPTQNDPIQQDLTQQENTYSHSNQPLFKEKKEDERKKFKLTCPVCLGIPTKYASTLCGHIFCESCIRQVANSYRKCPICQSSIDSKSYHPIYI